MPQTLSPVTSYTPSLVPSSLPAAPQLSPHVRPKQCASCGISKAKMGTCSKCQVASYCNEACQETDWPKHREACADHARKLDASRQAGSTSTPAAATLPTLCETSCAPHRFFRYNPPVSKVPCRVGIRLAPSYPGTRTPGDDSISCGDYGFSDMKHCQHMHSDGIIYNIALYRLSDGRGWVHDFQPGSPGFRTIAVIAPGIGTPSSRSRASPSSPPKIR